ncbi:MAG: hypothetical protein QXS20_09890 [Candidatus Thorarchaeota archaeon]
MAQKPQPRGGDVVYRVLSQDLYSTALHGDQVGIRQDEQWRAKSRQFTSDARIIGKIQESARSKPSEKLSPLTKTGFIVIRESTWSQEKDPNSRRLTMKLFSSSGNWLASIEEMLAEEYAVSYVSGVPQIVCSVLVSGSDIVTYIRQQRRGAMAVEGYSFYVPGPDGSFQVFSVVGKRATAGDDFNVVMLENEVVVAEIDSKFGDVGGEFVVSIKDSILANNDLFVRVLQCFSLVVRYRKEIWNKIGRGLEEWTKGKKRPIQHKYEVSLLANPRRITLKRDELEEV